MPAAYAQPSIAAQLRPLVTGLPHADAVAGVCVIDLATGKTVFEHHPDRPLTPASAMKVFVMATALAELGPDFAFETLLATDGRNLLIVGDGDPAFGDAKIHRRRGESITAVFERWADALLAQGYPSIAGDILIDDSIFEDRRLHPSWEPTDLANWYGAPVGGLNFNGNCVDITVSPAAQRDAPVLVSVQPQTSLIKIINRGKSGGKGKPTLHHTYSTYEYTIRGRCTKRWPFGPVSFPDPGLLFADSLRIALVAKGVVVEGKILRRRLRQDNGTLPDTFTVLARHRSRLAEVLGRIGKDSQNLFAECLLKRTGYAWAKRNAHDDPRGSWESGRAAINDWIRTTRIGSAGLVVADGSGLSRDNRCTARQLAALMAWMHRKGVAWPHLRGHVPDSREDLPAENAEQPTRPSQGVAWPPLRGHGPDHPEDLPAEHVEQSAHRPEDMPTQDGGHATRTGATRSGAELFLNSLSIAGVDGSLRSRLRDIPAKVFGKTGTMRGVRTLTGYVMGESGPAFAFAVMFNGYKGPSTPYKEIQDRICRVLARAATSKGQSR